jgi:hypothetical protein
MDYLKFAADKARAQTIAAEKYFSRIDHQSESKRIEPKAEATMLDTLEIVAQLRARVAELEAALRELMYQNVDEGDGILTGPERKARALLERKP